MPQSSATAFARQTRNRTRPGALRLLRIAAAASVVLLAGAWSQVAGSRLPGTFASDMRDLMAGRSVFGMVVLGACCICFLGLLVTAFRQPRASASGAQPAQAGRGHALHASDATDRLGTQGLRRAALMLVSVAAVAAMAMSFNGAA